MAADFIITITDRSRSGEFAAWFQQQGATLVLTALGRGTATMEILDYLGLEASEKAVLLCMLPSGAACSERRPESFGWTSPAGAS